MTARAGLAAADWYVPGEVAAGDWVSLNTNEAPLAPSPAAVEAIARAAAGVRRYPDPAGEPLRSAIARHHGVGTDQVFVGAGADGVLEACFRAFCAPGTVVAIADPTYPILHSYGRIFSADLRTTPAPGGEAPPAAPGAPLRFVVNPAVPTGVWTPPDVLAEHLADVTGTVVVDEVYAPFAAGSVVPTLDRHPRWLAVRSFSKAYGLAGLRVGYAVGAPAAIADLRTVANPYLVGGCSLAGAQAALEDEAHHRRLVALVRAQRRLVADELAALGWTMPESHANFLWARPPGGRVDRALDALRAHHVLVRAFPEVAPDRLRITVGPPDDNARLLKALRSA